MSDLRIEVDPSELAWMLQQAFPEGTPEADAIIERMFACIEAGESMTIDLNTGDVTSEGKTLPPKIYVVAR